jgi:hypothetical protein
MDVAFSQVASGRVKYYARLYAVPQLAAATVSVLFEAHSKAAQSFVLLLLFALLLAAATAASSRLCIAIAAASSLAVSVTVTTAHAASASLQPLRTRGPLQRLRTRRWQPWKGLC